MDLIRNPAPKKQARNGKEKTRGADFEQEQHKRVITRELESPPRHKPVSKAPRNDREREPTLTSTTRSRHSYRDERRSRSRSRSRSRERREERRYRDKDRHTKTVRSRSRSRERSEYHGKHSDRTKHTRR